jgi:hypothetical protein
MGRTVGACDPAGRSKGCQSNQYTGVVGLASYKYFGRIGQLLLSLYVAPEVTTWPSRCNCLHRTAALLVTPLFPLKATMQQEVDSER